MSSKKDETIPRNNKSSSKGTTSVPSTTGKRRSTKVPTAASAATDEIIFNPTPYDVLLGRGRPFQSWPGNKRFHTVVNMYKPRYGKARRHEKTEMAEEIVMFIKSTGRDKVGRCGRFLRKVTAEELEKYRAKNPGGGGSMGSATGMSSSTMDGHGIIDHRHLLSLQEQVSRGGMIDDGGWIEVTDLLARDKVSHALRGRSPESIGDSSSDRRMPNDSSSNKSSKRSNKNMKLAETTERMTSGESRATHDSDSGVRTGEQNRLPMSTNAKKKKKPKSDERVNQYRSHTEAIVDDLLRRKRGADDKYNKKNKYGPDERQGKKLKPTTSSAGFGPSGSNTDPSKLLDGRTIASSQQAMGNLPMGFLDPRTSMSLGLNESSLTAQISARAQAEHMLGSATLQRVDMPASAISLDTVMALRARNAALERSLAFANTSLRRQSTLLSGLDTSGSGSSLMNNLQLNPAALNPFTAASLAAPSSLATPVGAVGNPAVQSLANSTLVSASAAAALPGSSSTLIQQPSNQQQAQASSSPGYLSSLRDDQLLSILGRTPGMPRNYPNQN